MRFLETIFWIGFIVTSIVLREHLLFRLGGGLVFQLLFGLGAVCWRLRDRNETFWKYVECLSFAALAINFLYSPVTNWQDCLLSSAAFGLVLLLTQHFTVSFGMNGSSELKQLLPEPRVRLARYNLYKSGAFLLGWRNIIYSIVVPLAGFTAFARTDPQILRYHPLVLTYSLSVSTLIYALFVRKAKRMAQTREDLINLPPLFLRVFAGVSLLGLVYELVTRRHWFFYCVSIFFFLFALKTLPAYIQRSRAVLSEIEKLPDEWANHFMKTMFLEILFSLPYGIAIAFALGLLAALTNT